MGGSKSSKRLSSRRTRSGSMSASGRTGRKGRSAGSAVAKKRGKAAAKRRGSAGRRRRATAARSAASGPSAGAGPSPVPHGGPHAAGRQPPVAASSIEAYNELERTLYLLRDAAEAADTFEQFTAELLRRNMPEERVQRACDLKIGGDLHLHSSASDGKVPARKLPWLARAMGLGVIGLTDHDSIDGCREAFREGALVGVRVLPGVELSTDQAGLELVAYFPDAGRFFGFLVSSRSSQFRKALARRQQTIHEKSLACLDHVNRWLARQKVPREKLITLEEYDRWYNGQKPYFPGTLCVLGLARLSPEQRRTLRIRDPRTFNTRVATPFLRGYDRSHAGPRSKDLLKEDFAILRSVARAGVPVAVLVAHPKELITKGRMSLGAARKLIHGLARDHGVDGIEVACARDGEDDIRYWNQVAADYDASAAGVKGAKPLLRASHTSDFHVLGPGLSTGEITLGFGVLDSRPAMRRGNLRPQTPIGEFLEDLAQRARQNAGG